MVYLGFRMSPGFKDIWLPKYSIQEHLETINVWNFGVLYPRMGAIILVSATRNLREFVPSFNLALNTDYKNIRIVHLGIVKDCYVNFKVLDIL